MVDYQNWIDLLEQRQKDYEAYELKRKQKTLHYPNSPDFGGYEKDIKNAKYWLQRHIEDKAELLL